MEIFTYALKWSEAILRWGHVLFAILWVGNSFLFNYLDNDLATVTIIVQSTVSDGVQGTDSETAEVRLSV